MEIHFDILRSLAQKGPLKLTHVMYKANINCCVLKDYLGFLIEQELVEEKTIKKEKIVYQITERGLTVLKYFRELEIMLPLDDQNKARIPAMLY